MFSAKSRYAKLKPVKLTLVDGREIAVVPPRRPPRLEGNERVALGHDRLDNLARTHLSDAALYHRIGDANSELDIRDLLAESGDSYQLPERS